MPLPSIPLKNGHELQDCGTGDYALDCPEGGLGAWLHLGNVARLLGSRKAECAMCRQVIVETTTPQPEGQGDEVKREAP